MKKLKSDRESNKDIMNTVEIYNRYKFVEPGIDYISFYRIFLDIIKGIGYSKRVDKDGQLGKKGDRLYDTRELLYIADSGVLCWNQNIGFVLRSVFMKTILPLLFNDDTEKINAFLDNDAKE